VIAAWDADALPAPAIPTALKVVNIADVYHAAANDAAVLQADGLPVVSATTGADPATTSETLVKYAPGDLAQALAVVNHLSGAVMLQQQTTLSAGTVEVDLGTTIAVEGPSAATSAVSLPGAATTIAPTIPTPGGQKPSPSGDVNQPWDPQPCGG